MAEAIATLGLAANILQMVEYGSKFVAAVWKIYDASQADHPLAEDLDQLRCHTQEVEKILGSLEQNDSIIPSTAALEDTDRDLRALAAESRKVTEEILDSLNEIGKLKKHKAIQAAFKSLWHERRVAELQTKLDRVRNHLTLHLVHSLR